MKVKLKDAQNLFITLEYPQHAVLQWNLERMLKSLRELTEEDSEGIDFTDARMEKLYHCVLKANATEAEIIVLPTLTTDKPTDVTPPPPKKEAPAPTPPPNKITGGGLLDFFANAADLKAGHTQKPPTKIAPRLHPPSAMTAELADPTAEEKALPVPKRTSVGRPSFRAGEETRETIAPGVRNNVNRYYVAGHVMREYSLAAGVGPAQIETVDRLLNGGMSPNAPASEKALIAAWYAIAGFMGYHIRGGDFFIDRLADLIKAAEEEAAAGADNERS